MSKKIKIDDKRLELLADAVMGILTAHHATVGEVLAIGEQLIYASYGQLIEDSPNADAEALAQGIVEGLQKRLHCRGMEDNGLGN